MLAHFVMDGEKFFAACSESDVVSGRWELRAFYHCSSDIFFQFLHMELGGVVPVLIHPEVDAVVTVQVICETWLYLTL